MTRRPENFLRALFDAAVSAAAPARVVGPNLPPPPSGRVLVLGAGKASAAMAAAVEAAWPEADLTGLVVTRYGHGLACRRIEVIEAAHPLPDAAGENAARRMLDMAARAGPDDLVLALMSGGGSALLALPAPGVTLADKQALTRALLNCGAAIGEINGVRKHLSAIKGGWLAVAAAPAPVLTLAISDVVGDDPALIASGPTVPDPSTFAEATAVLAKYNISPPPAVAAHLARAALETPKPGDHRVAKARCQVIATPMQSLRAAAETARAWGVTPVILGDRIEGEARLAGRDMARLARDAAGPAVLISGGETTVTVTGEGQGGPNTEFLLSMALALQGAPGVYAISADTDGFDGNQDAAGAIITPDTLTRAAALGVDAAAHLAANDSHAVFAALGDLVVTGPTYTNVNDFRAILIGG